MLMRTYFKAALTLLCMVSISHAHAVNNTALTKKILATATAYQQAIACETSPITQENIIPLTPFTDEEDQWESRYVVLWSGDIGCQGGSGTSTANITSIEIGAAQYVYVNSEESSPNIDYESPVAYVRRVVSYAKDKLVLEGKTYAEKDPHCCPSLTIQFTLTQDTEGNWKKTEEHLIPAQQP